MRLTNLRRISTPEGDAMAADFTIADGRQGSVSVLMREWDIHGESALMQQARACEVQRRGDGYVAPGMDRFSELG